MGEVYRDHDTNLDRQVAIKVLPDIFSGDPERLARRTSGSRPIFMGDSYDGMSEVRTDQP